MSLNGMIIKSLLISTQWHESFRNDHIILEISHSQARILNGRSLEMRGASAGIQILAEVQVLVFSLILVTFIRHSLNSSSSNSSCRARTSIRLNLWSSSLR